MKQEYIITRQCPYCGEEISVEAIRCKYCGGWPKDNPLYLINPAFQRSKQPQVIVKQIEKKTNGVGTAGFVVALIGVLFSWLPGANLILWFLGLLLSFIGIFKRPRGLAVAGIIISIFNIISIIIFTIIKAFGSILRRLFN